MTKLGLVFLIGLIATISASADSKGVMRVTVTRDAFMNRITGQVWGPDNQPVPNIYIELNNEVNSTVGRQRTTNAGLYEFSNISSGLFRVHVLALGTDYQDQTQDVQVLNLVSGMSDNQYCDFHLKYDPQKVKLAEGSGGPAEERFAQEGISVEAEKHYNKGRGFLVDHKSEPAIAEFKLAVAAFPNYYYALTSLGKELVERGKYAESFEYLIRAIDVNQRSFTAYYTLAYACLQLKQIPEGIQAAKAAVVLKGASPNAQLLYGSLLRLKGDFTEAEKVLVKARTLGNNKIPQINWQLALVYNRLNKNKEAADELETYLKNEPGGKDKAEVMDLIAKLRTSKTTSPQ